MDLLQSSLKMGERLKELRERKNLSFYGLSAAIKEQYGVNISHDSLRLYEISEQYHSNAGKNNGMSLKNLKCLAAFFGVSSDYLLGLSDIRTNDKDLTGVCEYTGLTADAVRNLRVLSDKYPQTLSEYLSDIEFILYIAHLGRIREMANEINSFLEENRETKDFTDADIYTGMGKVLEMETNLKAALYDLDNSAKTARLNIANVGQLLEKLSEEYSKRLTQAVKTMDCDNG